MQILNKCQAIPKLLIILLISFLCACTYLDTLKSPFFSKSSPQSNKLTYTLSGKTIYADAQLAAVVYETDDKIRDFCVQNGYENLAIGMLKQLKVKYFTINANDAQYIVIRGTSNFANVKSDILASPVFDALSHIWQHKGFRDAALGILHKLENAYPKIQPDKQTIIVGHSLGGAIANVLGIYLDQNNFCLDRIITFGQPKITNKKGLAAYSHLPLFRVVGAGDVITCVPPKTRMFTFVHGGLKIKVDDSHISYTHFGDAANAIEDDPVSIHMDLDRISHAVSHKISNYIKRLKPHKDVLIKIEKGSK
jgi:predicted lipase